MSVAHSNPHKHRGTEGTAHKAGTTAWGVGVPINEARSRHGQQKHQPRCWTHTLLVGTHQHMHPRTPAESRSSQVQGRRPSVRLKPRTSSHPIPRGNDPASTGDTWKGVANPRKGIKAAEPVGTG